MIEPAAPVPLPRTTFELPDGRRIHVYGEVRGAPPADAPRFEPTELHMRRDDLAAVETATALFINDTLPELSAERLAAIPLVPREVHPGFVVETGS